MIPQLILSALLGLTQPGSNDALPTDPAQRCATKALAGSFGTLTPWQRTGYRAILDSGATITTRFVLTQYNGNEPDGKHDRRGAPCTLRHCAVRSSLVDNSGPWDLAYTWMPRHGLRQVLDCGSNGNECEDGFRKALRRAGWPDARWCDI